MVRKDILDIVGNCPRLVMKRCNCLEENMILKDTCGILSKKVVSESLRWLPKMELLYSAFNHSRTGVESLGGTWGGGGERSYLCKIYLLHFFYQIAIGRHQ